MRHAIYKLFVNVSGFTLKICTLQLIFLLTHRSLLSGLLSSGITGLVCPEYSSKHQSLNDSKSTYNSKNGIESQVPNQSKGANSSVEKKWYEGGTLHRATMREWKISTDENKLATCSDFIAKIRKDNGTPFDETEILTESYALKKCIDATQDNKSIASWKVVDIASTCLVELRYK